MKSFLFVLLSIYSLSLNGQNMNNIEQLISTLFVATDQGEWETVEKCFAAKVKLDYSSMSGNPAVEVTPQQITDSWKGILPGFDFTHHQIGNFITEEETNTAKVSCYGTATHVINAAEEKIWTVVGSYDFQLIKEGKDWKISAMTFNFKYQAGNTSLPQIAINRVKNGTTEVPPTTAEKNKATVKAFFKALENEKVDELVDLFDDQATHINPYHSDIFPKGAKGKEGIRAYWTPVFPNFDGMEFPIEEIYAMEDPNIVFVKYSGIIQLKDGAGQYKNNYYSTFKFNEEGKIVEYVEIFNPITAARGFGLLDQIK